MSGFSVSSEVEDGRAVVVFRGELDLASAPDAEAHLRGLEDAGVPRIVLDLRDLAFLDSTGLRMVLAADARVRRLGGRLVLVPGPDPVHRVFLLARLDERLEFTAPDADGGADE